MPGWRPDADADVDASGESTQPLFIEEALNKENSKFRRFPIGHESYDPKNPDIFNEPTTGDEWKKYNQWILGKTAPAVADPTKPLEQLILDFLPLIRRYNRALYTLRRLHLPNYGDAEKAYDPLPGPFTAINLKTIPNDPDEFRFALGAVKQEWEDVTEALNDLIDNTKGGEFGVVTVDMIEVNGYIVSMRLIGEKMSVINAKAGDVVIKEVGGSSSHVSITSPFGR